MIVRELIARLGFDTDLRGVKKWEQGAQQVQTRANGLATQLRGMFAAAAGIQAIKTVVSVGDAMQSLEARIKLLPQTIGDAGSSFDEVAKRASAARTSIEAYGNLYVRLAQSLRAFKYTQEDTLAVTDAISAALVVSGAAASEAASVTLQLSQAFNKGKLDGDEFRAFMEGLSADFKDKLAAEIGTTADKLFELSRSGELTAKKLADAFRKMAPEIQKQLTQMPMTVGQAVTIVGNKFSMFIAKLNRESQFVSDIAGMIIKAMDMVSGGIDFLSEKFNGIGNVIRYIGELILVYFGYQAVTALIAFGTAGLIAFGWMALIVAGVALVVAALDDLYVWIKGGDSVIGGFVGSFADAADAVIAKWTAVKEWFSGLFTWITDAYNNSIIGKIGGFMAGMIGKAAAAVGVNAGQSGGTDATRNVEPAQMGGVGKAGAPVVNNSRTTNVELTVPPGTPQEQQDSLRRSASKLFSSGDSPSSAEMGVYAT